MMQSRVLGSSVDLEPRQVLHSDVLTEFALKFTDFLIDELGLEVKIIPSNDEICLIIDDDDPVHLSLDISKKLLEKSEFSGDGNVTFGSLIDCLEQDSDDQSSRRQIKISLKPQDTEPDISTDTTLPSENNCEQSSRIMINILHNVDNARNALLEAINKRNHDLQARFEKDKYIIQDAIASEYNMDIPLIEIDVVDSEFHIQIGIETDYDVLETYLRTFFSKLYFDGDTKQFDQYFRIFPDPKDGCEGSSAVVYLHPDHENF